VRIVVPQRRQVCPSRFRDVVIKVLRAQTKSFNELNEDLATSKPTRAALVRWEAKNKALADRLKPDIEALVNSLPAEQRVAVRLAIYKFFTR
jgi:DNA-directed RNA polymerase specialized sigma24 family protein